MRMHQAFALSPVGYRVMYLKERGFEARWIQWRALSAETISCGDANWQYEIPNMENVKYVGMDIVEVGQCRLTLSNAR